MFIEHKNEIYNLSLCFKIMKYNSYKNYAICLFINEEKNGFLDFETELERDNFYNKIKKMLIK